MKIFLSISMLFITFNALAAMNKWVDAEGMVHYSDTRPDDIKVKQIKSSSAADSTTAASGAVAPKTMAEREVEWKKSQQSKEKAEQKIAQEKENNLIKQKNCDGARSNLATLERSRSLVTYNAQGEPAFMDDAGRAQRTEEARKDISDNCN